MQDSNVTHPPLDVAVNSDTSAFGFPSYLGLSQKVQNSDCKYLHHGWLCYIFICEKHEKYPASNLEQWHNAHILFASGVNTPWNLV